MMPRSAKKKSNELGVCPHMPTYIRIHIRAAAAH